MPGASFTARGRRALMARSGSRPTSQKAAHRRRPAQRCQQTATALGLPFETDRRLDTSGNVTDLLAAIGWPDERRQMITTPCWSSATSRSLRPDRSTVALRRRGRVDDQEGRAVVVLQPHPPGRAQTVLRAVIGPTSPAERRLRTGVDAHCGPSGK